MHAIYNEGGCDAEVKVAMAIPPARAMSNDLWDHLQKREPEFSEAIKEGRQLAEVWWIGQGKKGLFTPEGIKFNAVTWIFNMKNRFQWKDKQEFQHSNDPDNPISTTHVYLPSNGRETKPVDDPGKLPQHPIKK